MLSGDFALRLKFSLSKSFSKTAFRLKWLNWATSHFDLDFR